MSDREISRTPSRSRSRSRERRSPLHDDRRSLNNAKKYNRRSPSPSKRNRGSYSREKEFRKSAERDVGRRSGYRSRSPAPKYSKSKYSRSRSRSKSYGKRRSASKSPMRSNGKPDYIKPNQKCLGVFGLSIYTTEKQIQEIFSRYGPLDRVQVIYDAKTGKSRGYCFIYFSKHEDAKQAREQCSGMEIDERRIRVDFSITERAYSPTPGVYMGKATKAYRKQYFNNDRGGGGSDRFRHRDYDRDRDRPRYSRRRSPSPYSRDRRYRSRSRSYSPRSRRYR